MERIVSGGLTCWAVWMIAATLGTAPSGEDSSASSPTHREAFCLGDTQPASLCSQQPETTQYDTLGLVVFLSPTSGVGANGGRTFRRCPRSPPPAPKAPLYLLHASFLL